MKTAKQYRKTKKCKCGKMIWKESKKCKSCANKGKNNPNYIHGKTIVNTCAKCGKEISCHAIHCGSCAKKKFHNNRSVKGNKNPNWRGGYSPAPYPKEFNDKLKELIRIRDNHTCQICGKRIVNGKHKLSVHHIDYDKTNCSLSNLISLCKSCHSKTNVRREYWKKYFKAETSKNKKIIYTAGTFDLFNVGHLEIFKKSKKLGETLIVGVSTNRLVKSYKMTEPVISYADRVSIIESCKYVDEVIKQTKLLDIETLKKYKVDCITIGSDWKNKYVEGIEWMKKNGEVIYLPYTKRVSSSEIKKRIIENSYDIIKSSLERKE